MQNQLDEWARAVRNEGSATKRKSRDADIPLSTRLGVHRWASLGIGGHCWSTARHNEAEAGIGWHRVAFAVHCWSIAGPLLVPLLVAFLCTRWPIAHCPLPISSRNRPSCPLGASWTAVLHCCQLPVFVSSHLISPLLTSHMRRLTWLPLPTPTPTPSPPITSIRPPAERESMGLSSLGIDEHRPASTSIHEHCWASAGIHGHPAASSGIDQLEQREQQRREK